MPASRVVCIDNRRVQERERSRGARKPLYQVFQDYGINASGVTLPQGVGKPDAHMFRETARQIQQFLR